MEEQKEELKMRATQILNNCEMETFKNEAEIIRLLNKYINMEDDDLNYAHKILNNIEMYLKTKEKMKVLQDDKEFLQQIAEKLRGQEVRETDITTPPLFKTTNSLGDGVYFLTRDALNEYNQYNQNGAKKIIEIPSSNSPELARLIEIIKRNF